MHRLKSGAAILMAVCLVLGLAIGSRWLSSADQTAESSDPAVSDMSDISNMSDASDMSAVSDMSDESDDSEMSDGSDGSPAAADGDADGDGDVTMKDVLVLRMFIARIAVSIREAGADVYTDGSLDMKDVLILRQYVARWDVPFGPPADDVSDSSEPDSSEPSDASEPSEPDSSEPDEPDEPDEEMRAVWVAYYEVANLMKGSADATRSAIDTLMDNCADRGANTIVFHVRAYSDAYYDSEFFPLHRSVAALIGDGFDPLTYAVSAAHERGLQLHAWINPYRIGTTADNARCDEYFEYNDRFYYNPSSEQARSLILNGIEELVRGYDIDGIQFDDYFYPDGIRAEKQPFDVGYASGDLGDWRRAQVSTLIRDSYTRVHSLKPNVVFGVAPAANLENNLTRLYADVPAWMAEGWLDYVCPQVYYGFQNKAHPFDQSLAEWCALPRADGVRIYAGLALYKAGLREDTWAGDTGRTEWLNGGDILARQVRLVRSRDDVDGFMLFSYGYLMKTSFQNDDNDIAVAETEIQNLLTKILS
ncbi:MAG: family 10 glycosylhydrolase [Clostridia bacterium]|nr:family 10 glycosylhydrolase [Clostridia bacterium]